MTRDELNRLAFSLALRETVRRWGATLVILSWGYKAGMFRSN